MSPVEVTWLEGFRFVGVDSTKHSVVISKADEESIGMKPNELLLVALAACTSYDVVNILQKKRLELTGLKVSASAEQDPEPPWAFRKIHLHYQLTGRGLDSKAVEHAIRLSEEKYCSVAATLRQAAHITWDYEIQVGSQS